MTLHESLCKDYRKNPFPEITRFTFIAMNLLLFLYFSGYYNEKTVGTRIVEYKGQTSDENKVREYYSDCSNKLAKISLFDMIGVILAVYLAMKQLSFARPEVDSFNEIVSMPAQDTKISIILSCFSFFKLVYQFFKRERVQGGFFSAYLMFDKDITSKEERLKIFLQNLILFAISSVCAYYSTKFKFEMRNAEKYMLMRIINVLSLLWKAIIVMVVAHITFIQKNRLVGTIFLFAIIITIVNFIIIRMNHKNIGNQVDIKQYMFYLKWLTFSSLVCVVMGPLVYTWLRLINKDYLLDGSWYSQEIKLLIQYANHYFLYIRMDENDETALVDLW